MRAQVLTILILPGCLIALVRPQLGLFLYIWFSLFRPDIMAYAATSGLSGMLALATLIGSIRFIANVPSCLRSPIVLAMVGLLGVSFVSTIMAVRPDLSEPIFQMYLRVLVMALLIPVLVRTLADLRWCLLTMAVSLGVLGAKFGLWGLVRGGVTFQTAYGGFMDENNSLGCALVMTVPLCWYGLRLVQRRWMQAGLAAAIGLMLAAIVMMHSRGAMLSLAAVVLMLAFRSRHKLLTLALIVVLMLPTIWLVRESFTERMMTLTATGEQLDRSARSRLVFWGAAIQMWRDYPLFGVGFGNENQRMLLPRYLRGTEFEDDTLVIHNTYLQVLADSGLIAALLYAGTLLGTIVWLGFSAKKMRREKRGLEIYPAALQTSLMAFLIGATFMSKVSFDLVYMLLMAAASWQRIASGLPKPAVGEVAGPPAIPAARWAPASARTH